MEEKDLISKIKKLREIEPRKAWVLYLKERFLENEKKISFILKPILALSFLSLFLFSFVLAQKSLPGDFLYPLKTTSEKVILILTPKEKKPEVQLEITKTRLEELTEIAKENKIEKLVPALSETKKTFPVVSETIKEVLKKKDVKKVKKIVKDIKEIEEKTKEVESFGVIIKEDRDFQETALQLKKILVDNEIKELEKRSLTEKQKEILEKAKEFYTNGDYNKALELILFLTNNKI